MALVRGVRAAVQAVAGHLDDKLGLAGDERTGALAVRWALAAPLRRIAANSGADGGHVAATVAWLPEGHGWDATAHAYRDLVAAGVLDLVRVTRTALHNASSVAALLLTVGGLITDHRPPDLATISWRRRGHGDHQVHPRR
ncbi:TCP-1/cpn60 chaperonin family protein [Streptomyces sp. NPDC002596]